MNAIRVNFCLINGEITICGASGLPIFDLLRHGKAIKPGAVPYAFDFLKLDGDDVRLQIEGNNR